MAVQVDTEFMLNRTTTVIKCSTREKLQEIVNFLINCPDPYDFSYEGQHTHFFVVDTKNNAIHVSKFSAPNCIKWHLRNNTAVGTIPNLATPGAPLNSESDEDND